jgi:uncharacterized membrane protein YdjX (TVP38/TMEM64 family)
MKHTLILTAIVAGAVVLTKLLLENVLGLSLESAASAWLADPGVSGAAIIVGLLALDVFFPVPSSLVMVLSGAAFGVLGGAALALAGSIAGEWLGFELVRRYGRRASARMLGDVEFERFQQFFDAHGVAAVIVTRPQPIVMEAMSVVAGLSGMSRAAFLGASLLGTAPIVVVYAYAGAFSREAGTIVPAAVILVAVTGAGWLWFRARFAGSAPASPAIRPSSSEASRD